MAYVLWQVFLSQKKKPHGYWKNSKLLSRSDLTKPVKKSPPRTMIAWLLEKNFIIGLGTHNHFLCSSGSKRWPHEGHLVECRPFNGPRPRGESCWIEQESEQSPIPDIKSLIGPQAKLRLSIYFPSRRFIACDWLSWPDSIPLHLCEATG